MDSSHYSIDMFVLVHPKMIEAIQETSSFEGVLKQHEALFNGMKNTQFQQQQIIFLCLCLLSSAWNNLGDERCPGSLSSLLSSKPWSLSNLLHFNLTRFLLLTLPVSYCLSFSKLCEDYASLFFVSVDLVLDFFPRESFLLLFGLFCLRKGESQTPSLRWIKVVALSNSSQYS